MCREVHSRFLFSVQSQSEINKHTHTQSQTSGGFTKPAVQCDRIKINLSGDASHKMIDDNDFIWWRKTCRMKNEDESKVFTSLTLSPLEDCVHDRSQEDTEEVDERGVESFQLLSDERYPLGEPIRRELWNVRNDITHVNIRTHTHKSC